MSFRLPTLQATNLEGDVLELPDAFAGDPSVVVVAFKRRQQEQVDTWIPWLRDLQERLPGLEVYEIPAIKRRWLPARRFIDGGMRAGIPDPHARRSTMTVYTDIGALLEALGLDSTASIAVFVVARGGTVGWCSRGAFRQQSADQVEHAIAAARASRGDEGHELAPGSGADPGV